MSLFDPWNQFGGWDEALPILPDDVVGRWSRILRRDDPWRDMPEDDLLGRMRPLLRELLNEARDADHRERRKRVVVAAGDHGAFRCAQGCAEANLVEEFALVLEALRGALRSTGMGARSAMETVLTLEPELQRAERAALRGWYRRSAGRLPASGAWLDRLLRELE